MDKETEPTNKEFANMTREQQFLELVRKKYRKANKKMQRITGLEKTLAESKAKINEEQRQLLGSKEVTSTLLREFSDLQTQMMKLLEEKEKNESVSTSTPNPTPASEELKKKKRGANRQRREKKPTDSTENQTEKNGDESKSTTNEAPKTEEKKEQKPDTASASTSTKTEESQTQSQTQPAQSQTDSAQQTTQTTQTQQDEKDQNGKQKKDWEFQKDIYVAQYKKKFGPEHEGKFIAVAKGVLFGPFDTLEQLKQAQGEKTPGTFVARVGHEDDPPAKRFSERRRGGYGGRGRGGSRGGSGGRGGFQRGTGEFGNGKPREGGQNSPSQNNSRNKEQF